MVFHRSLVSEFPEVQRAYGRFDLTAESTNECPKIETVFEGDSSVHQFLVREQLHQWNVRYRQKASYHELLPLPESSLHQEWDLSLWTIEGDTNVVSLLSYISIYLPSPFPINVLRVPNGGDIDEWFNMDKQRDPDWDISGIYFELDSNSQSDFKSQSILLSDKTSETIAHTENTDSVTLHQRCRSLWDSRLFFDKLDESYFISQVRPFQAFCCAIHRHIYEVQSTAGTPIWDNTVLLSTFYNMSYLGYPLMPHFLFSLGTLSTFIFPLVSSLLNISTSLLFPIYQSLSDDQILQFYEIALQAILANVEDEKVAAAAFCFLDLLDIDSARLKIEVLAIRRILSHQLALQERQTHSETRFATQKNHTPHESRLSHTSVLPIRSYLSQLFLSFPIDTQYLRRNESSNKELPTTSQSLLLVLR